MPPSLHLLAVQLAANVQLEVSNQIQVRLIAGIVALEVFSHRLGRYLVYLALLENIPQPLEAPVAENVNLENSNLIQDKGNAFSVLLGIFSHQLGKQAVFYACLESLPHPLEALVA